MIDVRQWGLRGSALVFLCIVYGLFSSPTPAKIGIAEALTALGLLVAAQPAAAMRALVLRHETRWALAAQVLFFYALSVPVIMGLAGHNDASLMIRDIIPFCFLLLPLFMAGWAGDCRIVSAAAAFAGLAFAARVIVPVAFREQGFIGAGIDPDYLSIAPTLPFAAILCGGTAGALLYRNAGVKNIALAAILSALAILPLAAMVVTLQRAGLGLSILALAGLLLMALVHRPLRGARCLLLGLAVLACLAPAARDVGSSLWHKHEVVGQNNRLEEAAVVFDTVSESFLTVLFGKGWGATLADPAVGGVTVNYTHNIFTTYLLKTGLCGLFLLIVYLYQLCLPLWRVLWQKPVIAAALGVPLFIDLTLYASFKSLDFGLILLLIMLWGASCAKKQLSV